MRMSVETLEDLIVQTYYKLKVQKCHNTNCLVVLSCGIQSEMVIFLNGYLSNFHGFWVFSRLIFGLN